MNLSTVNAFKHIQSHNCLVLNQKQLESLQETLIGILHDVITVCEKYRLIYMLGGGSALGAIRHHGFIPWDDDIDINMPREDYEKFILIFKKKFKEKYWVHTPKDTKNYGLLLARIRKKGTYVKTKEDFFNQECGAFIDIFIIENTYDNKILRCIHGIGSLGFGFCLSCRKFYRDRRYLLELIKGDKKNETVFLVKILIGFFMSCISIDGWTRLSDKWNSICKDIKTQYVVIPAGRKHFFGELYLRKDICMTQLCKYENEICRCPINVDKYLRKLYGDYWRIPTENERETHVVFFPFLV